VTSNGIAGRLEEFIRKQFTIAASDTQFSRSVLLFENGYIDSVGAVELLAFIQEAFGVVVPDEDLLSEEFSTIEGIAAIIARMAGAPVAALQSRHYPPNGSPRSQSRSVISH
jgi:acyl carrier protein